MTRRSAALASLAPQPLIEISPEDANRSQVEEGQAVELSSRRGTMHAVAQVTQRVPPGIVFASFHFPDDRNANVQTNAALDPVAKIPEYKVCAVRLNGKGQRD